MVDTIILDSNDDLAFAGDLANGANLMSVVPGGTGYRIFREGDGSLDFDVSALTAGTIDQASPTTGTTLTVSGSNAPAGATFNWQKDGANISPAETGASVVAASAGAYRRGVTFGVQGPVYTPAVTVSAASGIDVLDDFSGYSAGQTLFAANPSRYSELGGSASPMIVNNGSYNVLRISNGVAYIKILDSLAANREMGFVIDQVGAANSNLLFNMSYIGASDYIRFGVTTGSNWFGPRQQISGSDFLSTAVNLSPPANGDKYSGNMTGSTLKIYKNDVQANSNYTVNPAVLGGPMLSVDASSGRTVDIRSIYYKDVV